MPENPFDKAARFAAQLEPVEFLTWLLEIPPARLGFSGWLDTRAIPFPGEPDRIADTVARLDLLHANEPPWAVAVEFQIEPDSLMFGRLLGFLSQLWTQLKPDPERGSRFHVGAAVVNLTGRGYASRVMKHPEAALWTQLTAVERNLATENAEDNLRKIEQGELGRSILPWLALMSGGGTATIIERWKRLAEQEPSSRRRAELAGLALVFAEAADCLEKWEEQLKGWNMRESVVVNNWRAEGRGEGRVEGRVEGRAETLLELLQEKFGEVPESTASAIRSCTEIPKLRQWMSFAVHCATLQAFRDQAGI
jgi:hypothetical protein